MNDCKKNDIFIPEDTLPGKGNFNVLEDVENFLIKFRDSKLNNCILSDEKFWGKKKFIIFLEEIIKNFKNVYIYFVFRNQVDLIFSHFIQKLNNNNSIKDINLFFYKHYNFYSYSAYLNNIKNSKFFYSIFDENFNIVESYYELLKEIFFIKKNKTYFELKEKRSNVTLNKIKNLNLNKNINIKMNNDVKKLILRYYKKSNQEIFNRNYKLLKNHHFFN
jgi:hypothetical protein